jgi:predicted DNA-binding protein (MmcQ/YjbR family)
MTARRWDAVREHALSLPCAKEDFPWGESVVKAERRWQPAPEWRGGLVHGPMFLWLGRRDVEIPMVSVKLTDSYDEARAIADVHPTTHSGLGQWGWLTVVLASVHVDVVCEWVEESYRNRAPRRLVRQLDELRGR